LGGYAVRQGASVGVPTALLHFGRKDESEADYLGLQYMYAAGYDPTGAISLFEKIESLNRKQPGLVDRIFSTHPMDADRIQKAEAEIQRILPARSEYIVNTSEYTAMRERMLRLEGKRKQDDPSRPVIRRSTATTDKPVEEDRPTIKRRDLIE